MSPSHSIQAHFSGLPDPRINRRRRHKLLDILVIALCAGLCGIDDWAGVELFATLKEDWFHSFLELPDGIPSHDTFGRVFSRLDPKAFESCFRSWIEALASVATEGVIAIDGKTLRGSFDKASGKSPLHMVSAFSSSSGLCLGQVATDAKSNEITAIPIHEGTTLRERLVHTMTTLAEREHALAKSYHDRVQAIPGVTAWGPDFNTRHRAPTTSITVKSIHPEEVARRLGEQGILVGDGNFYAARAIEVLGLEASGGVIRAGISIVNNGGRSPAPSRRHHHHREGLTPWPHYPPGSPTH